MEESCIEADSIKAVLVLEVSAIVHLGWELKSESMPQILCVRCWFRIVSVFLMRVLVVVW